MKIQVGSILTLYVVQNNLKVVRYKVLDKTSVVVLDWDEPKGLLTYMSTQPDTKAREKQCTFVKFVDRRSLSKITGIPDGMYLESELLGAITLYFHLADIPSIIESMDTFKMTNVDITIRTNPGFSADLEAFFQRNGIERFLALAITKPISDYMYPNSQFQEDLSVEVLVDDYSSPHSNEPEEEDDGDEVEKD